MAVYWNLVVDCGADQSAAERISEHFRDFSIEVPSCPTIPLYVNAVQQRGKWFVGVWPHGMAAGMPPGTPLGPQRAELLTDSMIQEVGSQLLHRLATATDFRRALFGAEAFDMLVDATPAEDHDIDYVGMIVSNAHFPAIAANLATRDFRRGYQLIEQKC